MLEGIGKRIGEVAERLRGADSETLWAMIQQMAFRVESTEARSPFALANNMLAATIIRVGEAEHWTPFHTALALAYAHIVLSNDHHKDINEILALQNRPVIMNRHCADCNCEDKTTRYENG